MSWVSLGSFKLVNNWQFSAPSEGEIFRINHELIQNNGNSVRGVIAQGFEDERVNIFNPKLFSYREETEIFTFYFPLGLKQHSLCLKRLDAVKSDWLVNVEVFQSGNAQNNLNNYLISRFGETAVNMALYPLLYSGSVTPTSNKIKLESNKPVKLRSENTGRTQIRIRTSGHAVLLATGFNESGSPLVVLEECPPNYLYVDQASSAGMYQGEIWAVSEHETHVSYTEYSAQ